MLKQWKTWIGFAISLAAILYAVQGVDWGQVGVAMRSADVGLLVVVFFMSPMINVGVRALRWKLLLNPSGRVSMAGCVSATSIGLMANNVLPARIGEFVRAYALGRRENVPTGTAFGGLFMERMLDGLAVVGLLFAMTRLYAFPSWVDTTVTIGLYVFGGFLAFQMYLAYHPRGFIAFSKRVGGWITGGRLEDPIERTIMTFADGFQFLRHPGRIFVGLALALLQWSLIATTYLVGLTAFGLGDVGWIGATFATAVTAIGVAVPSSPGFVGTYQALIVKALEAFSITRSPAFSYAVGFHAVTWTGVTATGLFYFFREGLSWGEIEASEETMGHELESEFEAITQDEKEL